MRFILFGVQSVNMYVDDQGSMKNLPTNRRATSLCFQAAQPLQVLGDAFMARYMDNEEDFYRTGSHRAHELKLSE